MFNQLNLIRKKAHKHRSCHGGDASILSTSATP